MKSMLIIASFIAMAVAGPTQRGLVAPGMPGPTPIIENVPISVGPALIDGFEQVPIAVGPAIIEDFLPVNPLPVNPVIDVPAADGSPLVQIILNINGAAAEVVAPSPAEAPIVPEVIIPGPVNIVDNVDAPIVPAPVVIGTPTLPEVVIPEPVVIGTPTLPEVVIPEPVVIGPPALPEVVLPEPIVIQVPIVPAPAVVLPEALN